MQLLPLWVPRVEQVLEIVTHGNAVFSSAEQRSPPIGHCRHFLALRCNQKMSTRCYGWSLKPNLINVVTATHSVGLVSDGPVLAAFSSADGEDASHHSSGLEGTSVTAGASLPPLLKTYSGLKRSYSDGYADTASPSYHHFCLQPMSCSSNPHALQSVFKGDQSYTSTQGLSSAVS